MRKQEMEERSEMLEREVAKLVRAHVDSLPYGLAAAVALGGLTPVFCAYAVSTQRLPCGAPRPLDELMRLVVHEYPWRAYLRAATVDYVREMSERKAQE